MDNDLKSSHDHHTSKNDQSGDVGQVVNAPNQLLLQRVIKNPTIQTLTPHVVMQLQRQHGNQFVSQLVQRAQSFIQRVTLEETTGAGDGLKNRYTHDEVTVRINTGHGYHREHSGGDVRKSGLTVEQLETPIVEDAVAHLGDIPTPQERGFYEGTVSAGDDNYQVSYRAVKVNGVIMISTYYPG